MTQRARINQIDMPPDQFGKGGFGIDPDIFPHQFHVVGITHLRDYDRHAGKSDNYFRRSGADGLAFPCSAGFQN